MICYLDFLVILLFILVCCIHLVLFESVAVFGPLYSTYYRL